jgi:hypothetical protein
MLRAHGVGTVGVGGFMRSAIGLAVAKLSRSSLLALGLLVVVGTSPAGAATIFTANMDNTQEVAPGLPGTTTGTAEVDLQLNDLGGGNFSLTMQILFSSDFNFVNFGGVDSGTELVNNLHVHNQARGASGGVVWGIFAPDHDVDNDSALTSNPDGTTLVTSEWDLTEGNGTVTLANFLAELQAATPGSDVNLYLNVHTTEASGGAIRGQFVAVPVAVPVPASGALLALGIVLLVVRTRRRG